MVGRISNKNRKFLYSLLKKDGRFDQKKVEIREFFPTFFKFEKRPRVRIPTFLNKRKPTFKKVDKTTFKKVEKTNFKKVEKRTLKRSKNDLLKVQICKLEKYFLLSPLLNWFFSFIVDTIV